MTEIEENNIKVLLPYCPNDLLPYDKKSSRLGLLAQRNKRKDGKNEKTKCKHFIRGGGGLS